MAFFLVVRHPRAAIRKKEFLLPFCQNPGIALSEVITSIEVEIEQQQLQTLVFMMKDIKKHYQGRAISILLTRHSSLDDASLILWTFFLDQTNYARRFSIHVVDLLSPEEKNHKLYKKMAKRFFTICKCKRHSSNIALDQAHEQNNKLVKTDGDAIAILENKSALLKWTVACPMVSDMLTNAYFVDEKTSEFNYHHEGN